MRPSDQTLWHEAIHLAPARCFGLDARGTFTSPDDGYLARILGGDGDRSPLARSIVSSTPVYMVVRPRWESPAFAGTRRSSRRFVLSIGLRRSGSSTLRNGHES